MGIQETATKEAPIQRQINTMAGAMLDVAKDLGPKDSTKRLEISFGKDPQGNPRPLELGGRVRK
jgi:hypothetical protein